MIPRTRAGLIKYRPVKKGSRIALVAPASPFKHPEFEAGVAELKRLGFEPVYDDSVFACRPMVAGPASTRADALRRAWTREDIDAIIVVRGGYGSVEVLPLLGEEDVRRRRTAFIGYSDVTSVHAFLNTHAGMASIHGVMVEGRLAAGPSAYDPDTFLRVFDTTPLGELAPEGLGVLRPGEASGPLFGGTLTQLLGSFGTPYEFRPPAGHVLFLDEVSERPYRLHRMLTQWKQAGRLRDAAAIVFNQLPRCDEPNGSVTSDDVLKEVLADYPGPVLTGFPSGHATTPLVSLPFGVTARVVAMGRPRLVIEESAAEA